MTRIHVCPLSQVAQTVRSVGARSLVTLIDEGFQPPRPEDIAPDRHLIVTLSDIVDPAAGCVRPEPRHVEDLLRFVTSWDREAPLVVHCWAGVSRSTAAAFIAACALEPGAPESFFARSIRANSPTASPNPRLVALADDLLARRGRMIAAAHAMGRGIPCVEARSFSFALAPTERRAEAPL